MIDLQVHQQSGMIGIEKVPYKFNLKIQPADLEVKQYSAQIELEQPAAILEIDYTAFRESLGYCGIQAQAELFSQDAKETCLQGIVRRAQEGAQMSDLSKKISIPQIADQATRPKERDLQLVRLEPVRVHFTTTDLKWDVEVGGVRVNFTPGDVQSEFEYGDVRVYLEREPLLEFNAVGSNLDHKV